MKISKKMTWMALGLFAVIGLSQIALETYADARAGGGRSGGFRGSRSYQAPSRPAQPAQQRRDTAPPPQQPGQFAPQSGGFMRGLGTAVLGGFLGSMLFQVWPMPAASAASAAWEGAALACSKSC
jgi:hypothetical protein